MISVGKVLADKYRIEKQLGRGGMGSVWLARHLTLGSDVAIKVIAVEVAQSESVRRRFLQEAKAAAGLRSPHVVQIFDYGIDQGLPFIVMELLVGETLGEALGREETLSPALTAQILTHVARGVQKAHDAHIVHRDLKPENIFLSHNDDEVVAKVLDFGVAKTPRRPDEAEGDTATGTLLGSPLYMSPEQAHGGKELDARSDLWSLGVIAFQCLTGRVPFPGKGWGELVTKICRDPAPVPSTVRPVPEGFDEWFERATRKAPEERFSSCREFVEALRHVLVPATGPPRMISTVAPKAARDVQLDSPANSADPTLDLAGSTQRSPVPEPRPPHLENPAGVPEGDTLTASSHGPLVTTPPLESTNAPVASSDPPLAQRKRPRRTTLALTSALLLVGLVVFWSVTQPAPEAEGGVDSGASPPEPATAKAAVPEAGFPRIETTHPAPATESRLPEASASASATPAPNVPTAARAPRPATKVQAGASVKARPAHTRKARPDAASASASAEPVQSRPTPTTPVSAEILRERE